MTKAYSSWGRVFKYRHSVSAPLWQSEVVVKDPHSRSQFSLAYGLGRSYGDVCLNEDQRLIDMRHLRNLLSFDTQTGVLHCEAGISIGEVIDIALPRGWFPPVVPGTKHVTIGGALANDIHGKNHHRRGTFGCHCLSLQLLRSDGIIYTCSPTENADLFRATIGGLGLTGVILSAQIQLIPASSSYFDVETIKYRNLTEYFQLKESSDANFDYTVAWVDATAPVDQVGRGLFMRGNFIENDSASLAQHSTPQAKFSLPNIFFVNPIVQETCRVFNTVYYHKQLTKFRCAKQHYDGFFFPLDMIDRWNLAYGNKGFYQYQFVVPESEKNAVGEILQEVYRSSAGSFLTVLKSFGTMQSPGLMSFPLHGPTLTLDIANQGKRTLKLFTRLDAIVKEARGRIYPAKDARMSGVLFRTGYQNIDEFCKYVDPALSSSFWRRMHKES